ncbi:MAG TPA: DinB family protein [Candidatus Acidoferrum sp.]|jgi:uncharacterized damage-inducible protein DinB
MEGNTRTEPWLSGTLTEIPAVHRALLHALQMAEEDLIKWCGDLSTEEFNAKPGGVVSVAFHVRHIAGSIDRLLTYAEEKQLSEEQMTSLKTEVTTSANPKESFAELRKALESAVARVRALVGADLEARRTVGRRSLPASMGGLLVHVAEHTQRHVGQAITTAKIVRAARPQ